ncbi:hypothetical protein OA84_09590 [Kaistella solincola]|uniref:Activator of Hsp90 ATPase homologue 1/2-like C-terminal domain-containing protein n=1 Tax=Kaistella solincola TaxID=510955 RepID=A0ABR4ZQV3_9FLAO|nr:SRPBCC domain-containing protein [Kaistella solincola]KIA83716.1 hypothetical protein OA84_09590 [Kaistella solincola]
MKNLVFEQQINANREKVWEVLFTQDAYGKWSSAMNEGTYFEGDWSEASTMKFLDKSNNGMYNVVEKNNFPQQLSMKHLGWIMDGKPEPQDWEDSTVSYFLESNENGTLLTVKVNSLDEFVDFFRTKYPKNLELIKQLSEE